MIPVRAPEATMCMCKPRASGDDPFNGREKTPELA